MNLELVIVRLENMPKLNIHDETSKSVKVRRNLERDSATASSHHVSSLTGSSADTRDPSLGRWC
jgi:hypothetical protein